MLIKTIIFYWLFVTFSLKYRNLYVLSNIIFAIGVQCRRCALMLIKNTSFYSSFPKIICFLGFTCTTCHLVAYPELSRGNAWHPLYAFNCHLNQLLVWQAWYHAIQPERMRNCWPCLHVSEKLVSDSVWDWCRHL